jgi:hypothetical protein
MALTGLGPAGLPLGRGGDFSFKQAGLGDILAAVLSTELDLTPPFPLTEPVELQRWLYENFVRVRALTAPLDPTEGVDNTFTTNDGKTVTVIHGVITDIT